MQIGGNIEFVEEIPMAIAHGAEYVGLYRTEFIYITSEKLPTEEDHFNNYRQVVEAKELLWSTIRTFDLGGDKFPSNQKQAKRTKSANGFAGDSFLFERS